MPQETREIFRDGQKVGEEPVNVPQATLDELAIRDRARQARARMRQIATAGNLTSAQQQQAIKDVARVCANLIPVLLGEIADPGD